MDQYIYILHIVKLVLMCLFKKIETLYNSHFNSTHIYNCEITEPIISCPLWTAYPYFKASISQDLVYNSYTHDRGKKAMSGFNDLLLTLQIFVLSIKPYMKKKKRMGYCFYHVSIKY